MVNGCFRKGLFCQKNRSALGWFDGRDRHSSSLVALLLGSAVGPDIQSFRWGEGDEDGEGDCIATGKDRLLERLSRSRRRLTHRAPDDHRAVRWDELDCQDIWHARPAHDAAIAASCDEMFSVHLSLNTFNKDTSKTNASELYARQQLKSQHT
jgi:hypothetical protein